MNAPRTLRMLLALGALIIAPSACPAASPEENVASAVTWYDSLQWPDVRGMPYMEVTFTDSQAELQSPARRTVRGFLLDEDNKSYHVFCDGSTRCILKSPLPGEGDLPATARELGPTAAVEEEIKELRHPKPDAQRMNFPRRHFPSEWLQTYPHVFVLARCLAHQGRTDLSENLDKALASRLALTPVNTISHEPNFRVAIEKWIFDAVLLEAVNSFSDVSLTRPQLLQKWERISRDFSGGSEPDTVARFVERLRTMIAEDEAHTKTIRPLAALSEQERVQELIFRLRDEDGLKSSATLVPDLRETLAFIRDPLRPGSLLARAPAGPFGPDDSPAHQLIRLGSPAVPALISALDDPHPTRCVDWGQMETAIHRNPWKAILTVGDCAETILFYISGRHFGSESRNIASYSPTDYQIKTVQTKAREWWRERQEKGEKQLLIEGVRAAGRDSLEQARHLVALDPTAAVHALAAAIETSRSWDRRTALLREMATIPDDEAAHALHNIMKNGTRLSDRLSAAAGLWQRGETDAVTATIREWTNW